MSKYLFLFTIGPVQSFISQARKTHDLYSGSRLLSDIIDSAMKKEKELEFIFPDKDIESKPNRFIAIIESENIKNKGKELEDFVKRKFIDISQNILDSSSIKYDNDFKESFLAQIKSYLWVNWVALELDKSDYVNIYTELESYLGAIKNLRNFKQLKETGRKCSICGERNVLFYKKTSKNNKPFCIQDNSIEINKFELNYGEGLCGICFTKRFYKKNYSFPSTAEISLMDKIPEDDLNIFKSKNLDPQLFFEENLTRDYFEKYRIKTPLEEVKKLRKEILDKNNLKSKDLSKYYALIMLDGDDMGKWLSGEFLQDKSQLLEFHKNLTKKLGDFAEKDVKSIIKKECGRVVYAGGDDVMAFVNLRYLLPVMKKLRSNFPEFVKKDKKSTASMGVVISHYKTPLSEVLKQARFMEHEAKSVPKKDAFAIAVLKRSGEIDKTVFKWEYNNHSTIEILENIVDSLNKDFSNTFIKNLGIEFKKLVDKEEDKEGKVNNIMVKAEIKRLIKKSCKFKGKEDEINTLTENLILILNESKKFDNFLSFLNIADFISKEVTRDDN